ncbi:MAG TPA: hypothetical protein VN699_21120 [Pirellulales bacterium]|nr:hypothetical protein [Pirellulales bacterium]
MSKKLLLAATIAALLLASTSPAFAYRRTGRGYGGGYGFGAGSTAAGSFLAGSAMLTQAAGQYNLNTAKGATYYQQAYTQWINNQKLREQTYFDMRRMNASYRAEMEMQRPHPTTDQLVVFSKSRDPERLKAEQLDPATAAVNWSSTLKEPEFAAERAKIEELFAQRLADPQDAGLGTHNYRDIERAVAAMNDTLHSKVGQIGADEYIAAHKFLQSLGYEARFAPESHIAATGN